MREGQYVKHPAHPEWGTGQVLTVDGDRATVNFQHVGTKKLVLTLAGLVSVENAGQVPFRIDIARIEELCHRFHAAMEANRSNCNDGKIAFLVLDDVKRRGQPTETHKKRLLNWCYTEGSVYQSGVELARQICIAIYGKVLPDPDKMN